MRRFLTLATTSFVALALLLTGVPAQAGEMSWDDAVDEPSTGLQATMDITKVTLTFDGATFLTRLDIKDLGEPAPFGTGQFFAVRFNYGDGEYTMRVTQDRLAGDGFQFQEASGQNQVSTIACKTCKYKLDMEANQVTMQIGYDSLKSALRKLAPGDTLDGLTAFSGAAYSEPSGEFGTLLWGGGTPGDTSTHPEGEPFTL